MFENEWLHSRKIVESYVKMMLGVYDDIVHAYDCGVHILPKTEYDSFYDVNSFVWHDDCMTIGLVHGNDVVYACQVQLCNNYAILKNYISKRGVNVVSALDECIDFIHGHFTMPIKVLIDRRLSSVPVLSHHVSSIEHVPVSKLYYSS